MSNLKKPIPVLHSEITEWKSDVELVRSEIATFQKHLNEIASKNNSQDCLLYTSPSPRDRQKSRMPSSA